MSEGIADGLGWSQANIHLESLHLVRKPAVAEIHTAGPKRGGGQSTDQRYQLYQQGMAMQLNPYYRYNAGANCNGNVCKFAHVCMHCAGPHLGHQYRLQNNDNNIAGAVPPPAQGANRQ